MQRIAGMLLTVIFVCIIFTHVSCAKQESVSPDKSEKIAAGNSVDKTGEAQADEKNKDAVEEEQIDYAGKVLRLMQPAPELDLIDVDGKKVTLEEYRGKTVILTFWGPKYDLCITQMKELLALIEKENLDAEIIAISPGEKENLKKEAIEKLKKEGIDVRITFDSGKYKTSSAYRLSGVPYYALVDREGRLQAAGRFLVKQKQSTVTFGEMVKLVAKGGDVPECELAPRETPEKYKELIGSDAPDFSGKDMSGNEHSNTFYKGFSRLLLVFWSPGCPHCRSELPRIELFNRDFAKERNVFVIGLAGFPEGEDKIEEYSKGTNLMLKRLGVSFPNIPDYGGKISDLYKIQGVPSMFLVGKDGKIEEAFSGEFLFTVEGLGCVMDRLDGAVGKDG